MAKSFNWFQRFLLQIFPTFISSRIVIQIYLKEFFKRKLCTLVLGPHQYFCFILLFFLGKFQILFKDWFEVARSLEPILNISRKKSGQLFLKIRPTGPNSDLIGTSASKAASNYSLCSSKCCKLWAFARPRCRRCGFHQIAPRFSSDFSFSGSRTMEIVV